MIYAIRYARFSSNNQREESIDAQLRAIDEYAATNGIEIIDTFKDEAQSGKNDDRDEFQQMIEQILLGKIKVDMILVHKFNRFARSTFDSAIYKKKLKEIGVRVVSVTQVIDDTPEGALLERFLEAIDEYYSANLALEVKKGLRENALKGKRVGGRVPLGYDIGEDGFYVVNEKEAEIVKRIFDEYANGIPKGQICEALNREGYRSKRGVTFQLRTIGDMLKNEKYIGIFKYRLSTTETIIHEDIVPAIIDKDVWAKVQSQMKKRVHPRPNKVNNYFLTGKAHCLYCGCSISGSGGGKRLKNGERLWYYECTGKSSHKNGCPSRKINKKWIESAIVCEILKIAFNDETIKTISALAFEQIKTTSTNSTENIGKLKKRLKQNIEEQKRLAQLFLLGKMDMSILETENEKLLDEKFDLESRINHIENISESAAITKDDVFDFVKQYIDKIKKSPDFATEEFSQSLINAFLDNVKINNEIVQIQLRLDFFNVRFIGSDNVRFAGAIRSLQQLTKILTIQRISICDYNIESFVRLL